MVTKINANQHTTMKTTIYYEPPTIEVIAVETEMGFAGSIDGYAPDSDDSEFGYDY